MFNLSIFIGVSSNLVLTKEYTTGTTTNVRKVADASPNIIVTDIGPNKALLENTRGTNPVIVAVELNIIGLNLWLTAWRHASSIESPSCLPSIIYSTSKIAFLITTPIKLIIPITAVNDRGMSHINSPTITPISDNGSE